ncbi:MAG TPA: o-succinylbenzoate--CoA ligase [Pseudogracilibacillus sp.]|nr:o-succinylbenzoate--CoA ligase [Pseudogracilibacillus sp.]
MAEVIPHWLKKQAELSPDKLAVEIDDSVCLTFSELYEQSQRIAKQISNFPLKRNERVAILSTNSLDMLMTIHALSYLDIIVVLLNTRLTSDELNYQLKDSEAKLLITREELIEDKNLFVPQIKTFKEIKKLPVNQDIILNESIDLADIYTIMYTSGTTGLPKAVGHTYGNHWWSAINSSLNLGLHEDDKWLSPLPMFHVGGFSVFIKSAIYGMPVYLLLKYTKEKLFNALYHKEITIASLVTLMLADFIKTSESHQAPNKLRSILLGGGSVPEVLLEQIKEKQIPLVQSYGMTETSSQIVTLSPRDNIRKLGSAGKPLMSAEVKIANSSHGIGEILVKGPMVINEYFNNPQASQKSFTKGWLKTGDLGYLDDEGFLYVVDRRSDLIISAGENIYPTEIENVLLNHDNVKEVAVVKQEDAKYGHVPIAYIVLNNPNDLPDFKKYLKGKLASYKQPKAFYYLTQLPRTASNKIKRFELEK